MDSVEHPGWNVSVHWEADLSDLEAMYQPYEVKGIYRVIHTIHDPVTCDYSIIHHGRLYEGATHGFEVVWREAEGTASEIPSSFTKDT